MNERFWNQVDARGPCWLWTGLLDRDGYGKWGKRGLLAHRFAWSELVGEPPPMFDHLCRVRRCVNPDHLEPVTPRVNAQRGQVYQGAICRKCGGSEWRPMPNGSRYCAICHRNRTHH